MEATSMLERLDFLYLSYSFAVSPRTGMPVLQAYVTMRDAWTLTEMRDMLQGIRVEVSGGRDDFERVMTGSARQEFWG